MKRSVLYLLIALLLLGALAACGQEKPTAAPAKAAPTEPASQAKPDVKTESWSEPRVVTGNSNRVTTATEGEVMKFEIQDQETYIYRFYEGKEFDDVTVETTVENFGNTNNGIALICRATAAGWYEFRISSSGNYAIYRFEQKLKDSGKNPYTLIMNGASTAINAGFKTNKLTFTCQGNSLKPFVNDTEIKSINKPFEDGAYTSGQSGIGVMSYSDFPVKVDFKGVSVVKP